eukprot:430693_1
MESQGRRASDHHHPILFNTTVTHHTMMTYSISAIQTFECRQLHMDCTQNVLYMVRETIHLRHTHQNCQMIQMLVYWKRYIQHKQNIKCHVVQLNTICTVFMEQKCFKLW